METRSSPCRAGWTALLVFTLCLSIQTSHAGSATWSSNPTSNDWNTAANWNPQSVPDQTNDVATFEASDITNLTASDYIFISGVTFGAGATAYTLSGDFYFQDQGIVNNSRVMQNIEGVPGLGFAGKATAGANITYVLYAGPFEDGFGGVFNDQSNAGSALFLNHGQRSGDISGSYLSFRDTASASQSTIVTYGPEGGVQGGYTAFSTAASAGSSTITAYLAAVIDFDDHATAAQSTLIADGGAIVFEGKSDGATAQITLVDGGTLSVTGHTGLAFTIGSLSGDGTVQLSSQQFAVGSNNQNSAFWGVIEEMGGAGGAGLSKVGSGTLTLSGLNTYTGGTAVEGGTLLVQTGKGSATGTGTVQVNAGTLGGRSNIAGAVTIGSGSGTGAFLAPGINGPGVLVIRNTVTFKSDGTYQCDLSTTRSKADQVVAKGVTIESGAQFALTALGNQSLPVGTVFTVINNKSRQQISGTFSNLPDHSTLTAGNNTFQVSYEGGDGNDLTLTVE